MNTRSFRRTPRVLLLVFAAAFLALSTEAAFAQERKRDPFSQQELAQGYVAGSVIAKPKAGRSLVNVEASETSDGYRAQRVFSRFGSMRVLSTPSGVSVKTAIAELMASGNYEYVEPDKIYRTRAVPNDTYFSYQWGLQNSGTGGSKAGADIDAVTAWNTLTSASSVIVAVIDSGARLSHPDLSGNLWTNSSEVAGNGKDDDGDGYIDDVHGINAIYGKSSAKAGDPTDDNGHGTHVSGIIGAVGNNGTGIAGVAWKVQIMPLKFLGSDGTGTSSDAIECIDYAIAHGANIINASYGDDSGASGYSNSEHDALVRAQTAGIIVVAAAGNDALNIDVSEAYPATYMLDNIVAVGNSTELDEASSSSNYGSGNCELFAPGTSILSLGYKADSGSTAYVYMSGTSMAAPHVAGALALIKAKFPSETYRQLINRLLRGAEAVSAFSGKAQTGGRLNLANALATTKNTPFNDDFSERAVLSGQNVRVRSSNTGATLETGEPAHAGISSASSLWWEWTAPVSGTTVLSTSGSGFNTLLGVYTGTSVSGLTTVASNDDASTSDTASKLSFTAAAGVSYKVAVASKGSSTGLIDLTIAMLPANDSFANAVQLSGVSPKVDGNNTNATKETGEPTLLGSSGGCSVWYRWTAPATKQYQASVYSSDFDPLLAVYTGSSVSSLTLVGANDNANGSSSTTGSLVTFTAVQGTEYWFSVETKSTSTAGLFTFNLVDSLWQYPTGAAVTNAPAVASDGTVYVGSTDAYFYALSSTGALKWRYAVTYGLDTASCAIADDGSVVFGSMAGTVYCLSSSGTLKWSYSTGSTVYNSPALSSGGVVYIKDDSGVIHAITLSSGAKKWTYATGSSATYAGPVIGSDGTVYVGCGDAVFYALDGDSGSKKWSYTADAAIYTSAAIDPSGNLFFATTAGTVYSLTSSGTLRWSKNISAAITSAPALSQNGTVYVGAYDGKFYALAGDTGTVSWTQTFGADVRASSAAVADDGTIYVGSYDDRVYALNSDGSVSRVFSTGGWVRSSPVIADGRLYIGSNDQKVYAFDIGKTATAGEWPMRGYNARRLGRVNSATTLINNQPSSQSLYVGGTLTLTVTASGVNLQYQWYKDGVVLSGATSATYTKSGLTTADAGTYTVVVTGTNGTVTSSSAVITVSTARKSRLRALSALGTCGSDDSTLIIGVVIGSGSDGANKNLVFSGVSSTLSGGIPNPKISVISGSGATVASNLDWGGSTTLQTAMANAGMNSLAATSKDAVLALNLPATAYTALINDETGTSGSAIGEIYDADIVAASSNAAREAQARLMGIAARAPVGSNNSILTGGFIIDGDVPMKVIIQGLGPNLASSVTGYLNNPKLTVYSGSTVVGTNDDWNGSSEVVAAESAANCSKIGSTSSKDAALVLTLEPGVYTAQLSSSDGLAGVGMIEIYEVP